MIENFDDEKIASMESFSKMAQKYAGLKTDNKSEVKVLSGEENLDLTNLALGIEEVGEFLKRLANYGINSDAKQFFSQLYHINKLELNDVVNIFELKNFSTHNPIKNDFVANNIWGAITKVIIGETKNIQSMLFAVDKNISKEKKDWLKNAIKRRLDMIELILE